MSQNVAITPCRPQNSIDSMGIVLAFKDPLQLSKEHWEAINSKGSLKSLFDKIDWREYDKGNRIFFEKFDGPEKILCKAVLTDTYFKFIHKDYRRWKYTVDFYSCVLKELDLLNDCFVAFVFLGYIDVFIVNDYENFNYSMLYKKSKYIPPMFFGDEFVDTKIEFSERINDDDIARIRIELSSTPVFDDNKDLELFRLKCDMSSNKLVDYVKFSDIVESDDIFNIHLTPMHNRLNSIFKELFRKEIQSKVGIKV